MKINEKLYSLEGEYSSLARTLNPYSANTGGANRFRMTSDDCSLAISKKVNEFSYKDLAVLALNFTQGRDFYSGERIMTRSKFLVPEEKIHRDHLFPASKCGLYAYGNVVITTEACNTSKSDMGPKEYYKTRFDDKLPTLYDTLEEAYEAIDFLHGLYKERYPSASRVVGYFDSLEMPMSWSTKHVVIDVPLFTEAPDIPFIDRGNRSYVFNPRVQDRELIWDPLLNLESVVYKGLPERTLANMTGREIIRIGNLFSDLSLDVKVLTHDEIISNIEREIEKNNITTQLLMRRAGRALIRHLGFVKGDINKDNEVVNGIYPDIEALRGYAFTADSKYLKTVWEPLLDESNPIYIGLPDTAIASLTGKEPIKIENLIAGANLDIMELSYEKITELVEEEVQCSHLATQSLMKRACRALIRQLGYINGDINEKNEVVNGVYPDIEGSAKLDDNWGVNTAFWEPFRNKNSELYDKWNGTSKQKNAIGAWHIASRMDAEFNGMLLSSIPNGVIYKLFDDISTDDSYELSLMAGLRRVMTLVANELGFKWTPPRKVKITKTK